MHPETNSSSQTIWLAYECLIEPCRYERADNLLRHRLQVQRTPQSSSFMRSGCNRFCTDLDTRILYHESCCIAVQLFSSRAWHFQQSFKWGTWYRIYWFVLVCMLRSQWTNAKRSQLRKPAIAIATLASRVLAVRYQSVPWANGDDITPYRNTRLKLHFYNRFWRGLCYEETQWMM